MRRYSRWILLTAPAAIAISACGGTPSVASAPTTTTTSTSTSTAVTSSPARTDPYADLPLIDHVAWVATTTAKQLQVFPTHEGRIDQFPAAQLRAWNEVLADDPTADTPGMHDQFQCHWDYARIFDANKTSWNLEPWRPAVGYQATVGAQCNPGGPEE